MTNAFSNDEFGQISLFDNPSPQRSPGWDEWPVPHGYEQPWGQLRRAAEAIGFSPDDLVTVGADGETGFERLVEARQWKPRTVVLYAKVAGYGGLVLERQTTPEPSKETANLRLLAPVRNEANILEMRAVAWCALALGWPAALDAWRQLSVENISVVGSDVVIDGRRVKGAGLAWNRWMTRRQTVEPLAKSPYAFCTVREGDWPDERQGGALSRRGLQAAFGRHAEEIGTQLAAKDHPESEIVRNLTYDTFRRLVIASGVEPVERGRQRALRNQKSNSAQAS